MKKPLVSIIIPVYNAQDHLARCIESVRAQSYDNLQIILVNDGSTDTSSELCHMFARADGRITLLEKENGGVAAARNTGLDAVAGSYVQFVDSDDYLPKASTEILMDRMQETGCDLAIAPYFRVAEPEPDKETPGGPRFSLHGFLPQGPVMDKTQFALQLMDEPASYYYGVLWNKMYRMSLIRENVLQFSSEVEWSEDFLFNLEYIRCAKSFAAADRPVYFYVNNAGSITHTKMDLMSIVKTKAVLFTYYKELYEKLGLYDQAKGQVLRYLIATAQHG